MGGGSKEKFNAAREQQDESKQDKALRKLDPTRYEVQRIKTLTQQNRLSEATKIIMGMLDDDPDDYIALFHLGHIMLKEQRKGLAYNILARAAKLYPDEPEVWIAYSQAHKDCPDNWKKIEWCLNKAIKLLKNQERNLGTAYANMAMLHYIKSDVDEAEHFANLSMEEDRNNSYCQTTLGFIHLAKGEWDKAWNLYDELLNRRGGRREQYSYGESVVWDGSKGKRLVINGEQGIGDELMYASIINEAIEDCEEVVIDCMPRLEKLFKRSFPKAYVYGQRWDKEVFWDKDHKPECHIAMASLPRYYRHTDKDFPGTPYLTADSGMRAAVRGLLSENRKPNVGIAWTGGTSRTRGYLRDRTLEELLPLLRHDVNWVSLEYRDRSEDIKAFTDKHGIPIAQYPWLTNMGLDYDLTAALVAELDLVISVPTTVVQMAGAIGTPCWVMVPRYTGWIFYRDTYPWADSIRLFKNTPIGDMAYELDKWLFQISQISNPRLATG
jgi:tetratricopeptide (TPR) repeat protein